MNIIVISDPEEVPNEAFILNALFEHGLEVFHLRKPAYTKAKTEALIEAIDPQYRDRVVLHHRYPLAMDYGLRGIHFTGHFIRDCFPKLEDWYQEAKQYNMTVSASKHQLTELTSLEVTYDYVFLSPIFDSISKVGYKSNFADLESVVDYKTYTKIVALGGVTVDKIDQLKRMRFNGAAVLGAIWQEPDKAVQAFMALKAVWEKEDQIF
ncbi:MAG TPA: hypothetical protein DCS93_11220 [Microscillaceae bacterium]|nr:hypothetical protein [Microscillaceae bacterium]